VKACIARGEVVGILADRVQPHEGNRLCHVEFLGGRAALPQGPFALAAVLGCPVLLMIGLRKGIRHYEIRVVRLADRLELPRRQREEALAQLAQRYADWLAAGCVREPYQWFNFYDFWSEPRADVAT
jgi:predicted LPLAT superfamily acyltransferase